MKTLNLELSSSKIPTVTEDAKELNFAVKLNVVGSKV